MRSSSLLTVINDEAIDGDLKRALRMCLQLGGVTGSEKLREWASKELYGYESEELPDYRIVRAPLLIDAMSGKYKITGQSISSIQLPDFAQGSITEEMMLFHPAPSLVELAREGEMKGSIQIGPPGSPEVVAYMNATSNASYQHIDRLYWVLTPSVISGVLETIRSKLVGLVAEMRVGLEPGKGVPTADVADQAVNVVVFGDKARIRATQSASSSFVGGDQKGIVRKSLEIAAWLAGIAAVGLLLVLYWDTLFG